MKIAINPVSVICFTCLLCLLSRFGAAHEVEKPFGYANLYIGFQLGYGSGFRIGNTGKGDTQDVQYLAIFPSIGVGISDPMGGDSWYQGNFDVILEAEFFQNFVPRSGYSLGPAVLLRYNFLAGKRLIPYAEVGVGIGYMNFNLRDQANGIIFYPQGGLGVHYLLTDKITLNLSYRYHHMSNRGTKKPNDGINANLGLIGVTYHFD